jgi:hypothetical protein
VSRLEVVWLKVRVVRKDIGFRGIAAEEFEKKFHWVSESANAGFAMADFGGECDSF